MAAHKSRRQQLPAGQRVARVSRCQGKASSKGIAAVCFDVGGTLIEPWPSVGHVYAEVAARHGFPGLPVELINRQFLEAWRGLAHFNYSKRAWAALVDATFRGVIPEPPSRTFFRALYARFAQAEAWRIYSDVLPVLETLAARGLKLGVISNWDRRLGPLLRKLELAPHFDAVAVSWRVGSPKPGRAIFAYAAERLGEAPETILHVGDSQELDVEGAKAAGLQALWLRRGHRGRAGPWIASLREIERHVI